MDLQSQLRNASMRAMCTLFAAIALAGCAQDSVIAPDGQESDLDLSELAPDAQLQELAPALLVFERNRPRLVEGPNIAAAGVSLNERGRPAMRVYVTGPVLDDFPTEVGGIPVILEETAPFVALQDQEAFDPQKKCSTPPCGGSGGDTGGSGGGDDPTARFPRPVPIGVSTGHFNVTAGTIGARVTDGTDVYALSNNHVYANENQANIGDNVLQPGVYDGGSNPADRLGTLAKFVHIDFSGDNQVDAAIALTTTADLDRSTVSSGYGTPRSSTIDAAVNMKVQKYGRTTKLTHGSVAAINATVDVGYSSGVATFTGQIILCCSMSAGGDSGSLIVGEGKGRDKANDRRPVGLLFAGNTLYTIANPIDDVLSALGVTIDGN